MWQTHSDVSLDHQQPELLSYDGHELSVESVHSLSAVGPDVWNSVPVAVRNTDNHPAFRLALESLSRTVLFLVTVFVHFTLRTFYAANKCLLGFYCRTGHCLLYGIVISVGDVLGPYTAWERVVFFRQHGEAILRALGSKKDKPRTNPSSHQDGFLSRSLNLPQHSYLNVTWTGTLP